MTTNHRDICTICNQPGHNASQCPGETWPRLTLRWLVILVLSLALGGVQVLMGLA